MARTGLAKSILGAATAALLLAQGTSFAQDKNDEGAEEAPQRLDLANFPGQVVEKVVVPIPAEVFAVLDKVDEPDWNDGIQHPDEDHPSKERAFLALRFGSLVAEGFIAVQAKSEDDIQKIGRKALVLSESLGLADAVRPHSQSIIESSSKGDWKKVRDELDGTQQTVRDTMSKLRDEELANLVSLGGWLRGTNVLTDFISVSFSEDKAELLHQPGLIAHFREVMTKLEDPSRSSKGMKSLVTGLARLEATLEESDKISRESVNELQSITKLMLEEFYFAKPEPKEKETSTE